MRVTEYNLDSLRGKIRELQEDTGLPIKFEGSVTQYVGRLNRIHQGKKSVIVYDYVDTHISYFDKQYRQRLTT